MSRSSHDIPCQLCKKNLHVQTHRLAKVPPILLVGPAGWGTGLGIDPGQVGVVTDLRVVVPGSRLLWCGRLGADSGGDGDGDSRTSEEVA